MNKICPSCHRDLPASEFGKDASQKAGRSRICLNCVRKRRSDRLDEKMEREVRILFNGRCIICDTVEDLEVIPMFEMKRRNPRACVLLCPKCKARGIPKISPYRRDCARCGHRWFARSKNTVRCPKCGSPYWNTLRR